MAYNVYSVEQLNISIKRLLAQDPMLGLVYVKGEISNLTYHRTGHIYFTLKDEKAAISVALFANNRAGLNFELKEGMEIIACGKVDYYSPTGKVSFIASRLKQSGRGNLSEKYEALKNKLEEQGMFDPMYKKKIPMYSQKIGVVTAPTGAAVRDIINISKRRNPYIEIILCPALVQGENAPKSIISAIKKLDNYKVDVIIVGRGGGSMEDLFCFNDEELAQTIFDCETPIISAVGHETDFTIADFVADLRAPTPSAAAELAVSDISFLQDRINNYNDKISAIFNRKLLSKKTMLQNRYLKLKTLSSEQKLSDNKVRYREYYNLFNNLMEKKFENKNHKLNIFLEKFKGLSPLEKLSQGYSFVADKDGKTVNSIKNVNTNDLINIFVKDGEISATVLDTKLVDRIGE